MMPSSNVPTRVGMITVEPHGRPWAEVISRMPDDIRMDYAWDYSMDRARSYADKYAIPHVVGGVEEMVGKAEKASVPPKTVEQKPSFLLPAKRGDTTKHSVLLGCAIRFSCSAGSASQSSRTQGKRP